MTSKDKLEPAMDISRDYFDFKGKKAEQLVHDLARKTFLTDWCYLNPQLPNGKELCDLLVVFDDVAIIWQVKDLKLATNGRHKASDVEKNLRQLAGARRQLFDLGTKVELQNPRRGKEIFDAGTITEIFLVSALVGDAAEEYPFVQAVRDHTVHVLTRESMQILLGELDTIHDFCSYLRGKEKLVSANKEIIILGGEEELLASYLVNNRSFDELAPYSRVMLDEGGWKKLQGNRQFQEKKKLDQISYGWDSIINRAHEGSAQYELVARELARPNRFHRRALAKAFYDAHVMAHRDQEHNVFRRILVGDGVTHCFLFADDPEPRERRRAMLGTMCYIARGMQPKHNKVIGIATEKEIRPTCAYDFCFLSKPDWTAEDQIEMERLQAATGVFTNLTVQEIEDSEYPLA